MKKILIIIAIIIASYGESSASTGISFTETGPVFLGSLVGNGAGLTNVSSTESSVFIASATITTSTGVFTLNGLGLSTNTYSGYRVDFDLIMSTGTFPVVYSVYCYTNGIMTNASYTTTSGPYISNTINPNLKYHGLRTQGSVRIFFTKSFMQRDNRGISIGVFTNDAHEIVASTSVSYPSTSLKTPVSAITSLTFTANMLAGLHMMAVGSSFSVYGYTR
jgi:hypothetical protein